MHRLIPTDAAVFIAVRAQMTVAELRDAVIDGAERRRARLRDDGEIGSQTAEYAMLGGVGAAACGGLVALLKNEDFLKRILEAVVGGLTKAVKGWF